MTSKRFTREQIQKILDGMSARDIFEAMPANQDTEKLSGTLVAGKVFDVTAARQGHGENALDRVGSADAIWLATQLSESLNVGSPKADGTGESPTSAVTGDSAQS